MKNRAERIRKFLLDNIPKYPQDIVSVASSHFSVTRTTIHNHLGHLSRLGKIIKTGSTRNSLYYISSQFTKELTFTISKTLSESEVWMHYFNEPFSSLPEEIDTICYYGFTEMFNNAIDHSEGKKINVSSYKKGDDLVLQIEDDGVGIFNKLTEFFSLDDPREAILQLSIGKMTTDSKNHTGQGVFFSSRVFDKFEIFSSGIRYFRDNIENDWFLDCDPDNTKGPSKKGTQITMTISVHSEQNLVDTFKAYQDDKDIESFNRTEILIELSRFGEERFISRSQAKRICRNLDKFERATLDFKDVKVVGQGFVDEVFRVYLLRHPSLKIDYINANSDVEFMIKRGISTTSPP